MGEDLGCSRTYERRLLGPEGREGGDGEGAGIALRATPAETACRGEKGDREVSQEGPVRKCVQESGYGAKRHRLSSSSLLGLWTHIR